MHKVICTLVFGICLSTLSAQNVGIGTASPQARLHVTDSAVLFQGPATIPVYTLFAPPASGDGVRFMWYPQKGALRAGYVSGTNWDKDSIGLSSIALGYNTKAKGDYSFSLGYNSISNGINSFSSGFSTTASGTATTSMGWSTTASGNYSTSMGVATTASGHISTSMGASTHASGSSSTSMGVYTTASGYASTSMGEYAVASGYISTSMGGGTTASGQYSTSMGAGTTASGNYSTSMGLNTKARTASSLVVGQFNDSTSVFRLFEVGNGASDISRNDAFLVQADAKVGINKNYPQSMLHVARSASGGSLDANAVITIEDNSSSFLQFSNGNGAEGGLLSGNASTSIRSALIFTADSSVQLRSGGNSTRLHVGANGRIGIGTTTPSQSLHVIGNILASGTVTPSDFRYKTEIKKLEDPLGKLAAINGVSYYYKTSAFPEMGFSNSKQVGVIAQEVETVLPEVVVTDANGYKAVDYAKLVPLLIEGMKAQQQQLNKQQQEIDALRKQLEAANHH